MSSSRRWISVALLLLLLLPALLVMAQTSKKSVRRAKWPEFNKRDTEAVFFEDVFSRLQGERPATLAVAPRPAGGGGKTPATTVTESAPTGEWAAIISSTTIEDEVKSLKMVVDEHVTTPGKFAGNDYKVARRTFSLLAMLFAIVNEYDGNVRWKDDAAVARDVFARTASNAKVGTIQVYNEANLRKQDLQDLIGGAKLAERAAAPENDWSQIADRAPLMQRLETIMQRKLQPWTASANDFSEHSEEIFHEAEILAAISEAMTKSGMADADDEDYAAFAESMKKAARDVVDAVKLKNREQAAKAVGEINRACSECHELYRA